MSFSLQGNCSLKLVMKSLVCVILTIIIVIVFTCNCTVGFYLSSLNETHSLVCIVAIVGGVVFVRNCLVCIIFACLNKYFFKNMERCLYVEHATFTPLVICTNANGAGGMCNDCGLGIACYHWLLVRLDRYPACIV